MAKNKADRNSETKNEIVLMVGDLPTPEVRRLHIDTLSEQVDNVREEITFTTTEDVQVIRSLAINGQLPGHLLIISLRPDGTNVVLVGNRRTSFIKLLRDPARFDAVKKSIPPGPFKDIDPITDDKLSMIECLVYTGLTESQEAQIRADHIGVKKLGKWDRFTQVIQLLVAGLTTMQVESQTGISHGSAERELWRFEMDPIVVQNYHAQLHDNPCIKLSVENLKDLHMKWNEDKNNSIELPTAACNPAYLKLPNGKSKVFQKFGPLSQMFWDELVEKDRKRKAGEADRPASTERASRTQKQHESNADLYKDAPFTSGYAKWAAGDLTVDLGELYTAELAYIAEHKRLVRAYEDLVVTNLQLTEDHEQLREDLGALREVIEQYEEASREKKQLEFIEGEVIDVESQS